MPLPRKSISALSTFQVGTDVMKKKIVNDIMYYLRRLIKLGRRLQTLQIREGVEDTSVYEEFERLAKEVDDLEKSLRKDMRE